MALFNAFSGFWKYCGIFRFCSCYFPSALAGPHLCCEFRSQILILSTHRSTVLHYKKVIWTNLECKNCFWSTTWLLSQIRWPRGLLSMKTITWQSHDLRPATNASCDYGFYTNFDLFHLPLIVKRCAGVVWLDCSFSR